MMPKTTNAKTPGRLLAAMLAAAFILSGCNTSGYDGKQTIGSILGAALGGLAGSEIGGGRGQLVAVAVGTALGGMIGKEIGKSLDDADRAAMSRAENQALTAPVGEPIAWNNSGSGNYGQAQTVRDGWSSSGAYCREFRHSISVGSRIEDAYGTACQRPDGSWRVVN
jgi:surface antigen